jgi:hypothetical protein
LVVTLRKDATSVGRVSTNAAASIFVDWTSPGVVAIMNCQFSRGKTSGALSAEICVGRNGVPAFQIHEAK